MSIIHGKVVIITGASSGIGAAIAKALARHGARLVLAAPNPDRLREVQQAIEADGGQALIQPTDVRKKDEVAALIAKALAHYGDIDVLINNAGVMPASFLVKNATDEWDALIDVNIKGVLYGIGAVLPHLRKKGEGHIVNISSNAAHDAISPYATVYGMTKHAVRLIGDGLRQEEAMAGSRIKVTEIAPGSTHTNLVSTGTDPEMKEVARQLFSDTSRLLKPEQVADAVLYALSAPDSVLLRTLIVQPTGQ